MRRLKTLVPALVALLMLGMATAPIAAQTPAAEQVDIKDLEGIQKAYSRTYTADMMGMFGLATPDAQPSGWLALTAMVFEFDNADHAKAANELLLKDIENSDMTGTGARMEDATLDVNFDYTAKQATIQESGMTTTFLVATAQEDKYIYAAIGITFGDDPAGATGSVLQSMKDADTSGDQETFHDDGTSTGGLWAKLPTLEQVQEQVPALVEVMDEIGYPEQDGTPAA